MAGSYAYSRIERLSPDPRTCRADLGPLRRGHAPHRVPSQYIAHRCRNRIQDILGLETSPLGIFLNNPQPCMFNNASWLWRKDSLFMW